MMRVGCSRENVRILRSLSPLSRKEGDAVSCVGLQRGWTKNKVGCTSLIRFPWAPREKKKTSWLLYIDQTQKKTKENPPDPQKMKRKNRYCHAIPGKKKRSREENSPGVHATDAQGGEEEKVEGTIVVYLEEKKGGENICPSTIQFLRVICPFA